MTIIRTATIEDRDELQRLREALWPGCSPDELDQVSTLPSVVFVAESDGALAGFLEAGLRSHADGCDTSRPVGYVEGWYVAELHRGQGVGSRLLSAAENWARSLGCAEMASDTWLDNEISQRVHEALGFEEVDRCVLYRKSL